MGALQPATLASSPQPTVPVGGYCSCGRPPTSIQPPPWREPWLQPAWPWPTTLVKGLAMADHPLSSLPLLQKCSNNA
ncbi:hypothetical protein BHE74_00037289 [Ensete ventricosum]|nr:hypothetical protein GW17_00015921 [Ensete ventricosum]RWW56018.1 hypothetical protein BHE74_00037289 [Ensete ventricosum]